jgi:hypothetical protein
VHQRWFSRRALTLHAVVIVLIPAFLAACIWQVNRALGGNGLSWAYVFEWPFFALYAVYLWWKLIHDIPLDDKTSPVVNDGSLQTKIDTEAPTPTAVALPEAADDEDGELAAYNRYLSELDAQGDQRHWR